MTRFKFPASINESAGPVVCFRAVETETRTSLDDLVRLLAYQKWEAAGRPESDGVDFWLDAEFEVLQDQCFLPEDCPR
jgi:hypothetical protein